ncbi:MAG: L-threonylcarbamoyladenylate synthase [Candidatus Nanopelagicales bacterium]|jgi:L-threonylcarbamoyladenylate synthase
MSIVIDCGVRAGADRERGIVAATAAIRRGNLVVIPTETSYAVAGDAFTPAALEKIRKVKGRGDDLPLPVLVASARMAQGIVTSLSDSARDLIDAFWPGPLTVLAEQQPTLAWSMPGNAVSVRMPIHPLALELISRAGPVVATAANVAGAPPPRTAAQAQAQLGDDIAVYLDAGPRAALTASCVVDVTVSPPVLLRPGPYETALLQQVCPDLVLPDLELPDLHDSPESSA